MCVIVLYMYPSLNHIDDIDAEIGTWGPYY